MTVFRALLRRQAQAPRWPRSRRHGQSQTRWQSSSEPTTKTRPTSRHPRAEDPVPVPNTVATLPLWQRLGPLTRLAEAYARAQRRRPYVTQLCSSLAIYFCADLSAQRMGGKGYYDPSRTARSLLIGAISSIPSYKWSVSQQQQQQSSSSRAAAAASAAALPLTARPRSWR